MDDVIEVAQIQPVPRLGGTLPEQIRCGLFEGEGFSPVRRAKSLDQRLPFADMVFMRDHGHYRTVS